MYRKKKKKVVDPNAPPRPNLLSHEKKLKDTTATIEQQQRLISDLILRIESLESKSRAQHAYLTELHNQLFNIKTNRKN